MSVIGFIMFIAVILCVIVFIFLKMCGDPFESFNERPYIVLIAACIILIYVIPPILLFLYGTDGLISSFENIVGTLLISYFYEKLLMGMFKYSKVNYFKDNLGKVVSEQDIKDAYIFDRLEQVIRILLSISIVSVYCAVFSYSYIESLFCWLPDPFMRLIIIELIFVVLILLLVISFHVYLNKTIKNTDD